MKNPKNWHSENWTYDPEGRSLVKWPSGKKLFVFLAVIAAIIAAIAFFNLPFIVIVFAVPAIAIVLELIFGDQCPECKKAHAMKRTGNKMASRQYIFGGTNYEKKCDYCGHCVWEDVPNVRGGGGVGGGGDGDGA
jgi:hypothetical protein